MRLRAGRRVIDLQEQSCAPGDARYEAMHDGLTALDRGAVSNARPRLHARSNKEPLCVMTVTSITSSASMTKGMQPETTFCGKRRAAAPGAPAVRYDRSRGGEEFPGLLPEWQRVSDRARPTACAFVRRGSNRDPAGEVRTSVSIGVATTAQHSARTRDDL